MFEVGVCDEDAVFNNFEKYFEKKIYRKKYFKVVFVFLSRIQTNKQKNLKRESFEVRIMCWKLSEIKYDENK